jgi:hypothetical protein
MPILASNFRANSLQGIVYVSGGYANIDLPVDAFALEGQKNFVVKLRRDSFNGPILSVSNTFTINDYTTIVGLAANISTVNEGNLVQFTLTTTNVVNYTNVIYSVFPVTANVTSADFVANTGYVTIVNNVGVFALQANADLSLMDENGEVFRAQIKDKNNTNVFVSSNITIGDVSRGINVLSFTESATTTAEGGTLTLTFTATNANNIILYYSTDGNATTSTFTGGNTGSFILNGLSNTFTLLPTGVPYSTTQNFRVVLRSDTATGPVIATSNSLIVVDSAIAFMTATGGNVATISGYNVHTFNTSGVLNVTYLGALGQLEILSIGGGGSGGARWPTTNQGGSGGGAGGYVYVPAVSTVLGNLTVTIGAGGAAGGGSFANNGSNTSVTGPNFSNILSVGGGYGGHPERSAKSGGSGGGSSNATISQGIGYGFPSPTQQGYPGGGTGSGPVSGWHAGGGGAGGYGGNAYTTPPGSRFNGVGGVGLQSSISGSAVYYAGGGGGGSTPNDGNYTPGAGGLGGGGYGGPGTVNTGGGGGGGGGIDAGGNGGSGIVLIRYPYTPPTTVSNVLTTSNVFAVGSNITFTINAQNANLLTLYYSTDGNVTSANFIDGNTGSFVANASGGIVTLKTNPNIPLNLNESRSFRLQIRQDSTTGFISGSSANIIISNILIVTYLAVAGGGGGQRGGGGAGGLLASTFNAPVGDTIVITVGGGGAGGVPGGAGSNSIISSGPSFANIIAIGGGWGGPPSGNGGSGGGAGFQAQFGSGYNYPGPAQQGYPGGSGDGAGSGGGGGGAGAVGQNVDGSAGGRGGNGALSSINGTSLYYAGGGGAGGTGGGNPGGLGGGGTGVWTGGATTGNVNTGGGGGGTSTAGGVAGGSGIVTLRFPSSTSVVTSTGNVLVTTDGSSKVYQYYGSGTIKF